MSSQIIAFTPTTPSQNSQALVKETISKHLESVVALAENKEWIQIFNFTLKKKTLWATMSKMTKIV